MLTRICQGICPEEMRSEKTPRIRAGAGMISGLSRSLREAISQIAISAMRNTMPRSLVQRILCRLARQHAMAPLEHPCFERQKQPIKRISERGYHDNTCVHVAAVHRALFIQNKKPQSFAAGHHLRRRDQDERDGETDA